MVCLKILAFRGGLINIFKINYAWFYPVLMPTAKDEFCSSYLDDMWCHGVGAKDHDSGVFGSNPASVTMKHHW